MDNAFLPGKEAMIIMHFNVRIISSNYIIRRKKNIKVSFVILEVVDNGNDPCIDMGHQ